LGDDEFGGVSGCHGLTCGDSSHGLWVDANWEKYSTGGWWSETGKSYPALTYKILASVEPSHQRERVS
jgi:hypothetical protein